MVMVSLLDDSVALLLLLSVGLMDRSIEQVDEEEVGYPSYGGRGVEGWPTI